VLHLAASGIKKPNLERCAALRRIQLVQFRVIIGRSRADSCEDIGTPGARATASITNATAEIVTAISLSMTISSEHQHNDLTDFNLDWSLGPVDLRDNEARSSS
jgi:hypothetical protein